MKKLFSITAVLLLALVLTGCTSDVTDLQTQITELQTQVTELQANYDEVVAELNTSTTTNETLVEANELLQIEVSDLQAQIAALQAQVYDNVVTVRIVEEDGTIFSDTVGYNDDFTGNMLDILISNFNVQYDTYDFGRMMTGIDNLQAMTGNYIAVSKNGAMIAVGLEQVEFDNADVFSFEISWWDMQAKAVYDSVSLFVDNQAADFVNNTSLDYNVVIALDMLGILEDYVTVEEVMSLVDISSMTSWNEYVKAAYLLNSVGVSTDPLMVLLNDNIDTVSSYGYTSVLNTMVAFNNTLSNFSSFETTVLNYYDQNHPVTLGVDTGGSAVVTLSNYETVEIEVLITEYTNYISSNQLLNGGISEIDLGWGPGTENSPVIASAIRALLSNGIDPTGLAYTKGDNNLITRLIEFQNVDGSFDYLFEDADSDLMFSTPQAFLALVAYQEYINNSNEAVNPYN